MIDATVVHPAAVSRLPVPPVGASISSSSSSGKRADDNLDEIGLVHERDYHRLAMQQTKTFLLLNNLLYAVDKEKHLNDLQQKLKALQDSVIKVQRVAQVSKLYSRRPTPNIESSRNKDVARAAVLNSLR